MPRATEASEDAVYRTGVLGRREGGNEGCSRWRFCRGALSYETVRTEYQAIRLVPGISILHCGGGWQDGWWYPAEVPFLHAIPCRQPELGITLHIVSVQQGSD